MSHSPQISVPKEIEAHPWRMVALIIGLLAVMIIVAYGVVTVTAPDVSTDLARGTEGVSAAENPELNLFSRYQTAAQARAEMSFLANNPEIRLMQRYREMEAATSETNFLAQNPEIMLALRYQPVSSSAGDHDFLARNPEVMAFRRFAED